MNSAKRILLVQSDQYLMETRKAILELQGYQVQAVHTVEGARVICENLACDLVIVDTEQDYQAAIELCDEIKAANPETNVAVMTWTEPTLESECPDAVIPRDRGPQEFLNRVRMALLR
jgi:DNA-binding NtrC family response regulator